MEGVGAEFEEPAEGAWGRGGPEGEFLHEGGLFVGYEGFEGGVEGGEVRVVLDGVEGGMVAVVAFVFPYMHFLHCQQVSLAYCNRGGEDPYQKYRSLPPPSSSFRLDGHDSRACLPPSDTNPPPASRTRLLYPA